MTHLKRPWWWERLKTRGEGDDRGWDDWMASPTQWTWVWVSSRSWWWTGKPGVLQSMGSQRVGHDWATELNWTEMFYWRWSWKLVTQSCPTLCDPMGCSLPGSSIHGIFQARVLEWGAIAFSDICVYIFTIYIYFNLYTTESFCCTLHTNTTL